MATQRFLLPDDYNLRLAIVEEILEQATARNDLAEMAFCYRNQGSCIINLSEDFEQASTIFHKAYQLHERLGDDYGRVGSLRYLSAASWNTPDKQIDFLMQALQLSVQLNNPLQILYTNEALASTYSYGKGDNITAELHLIRAIELAQRIGASHEVIWCQVTLGWMATNSGNFDKARSYAQACIKSNQDLYGYYERWHPYIQMAIVKSVADEDYEAGYYLAQQAHKRAISADGLAVSSWGISFPLIGLARYQEAASYVRRWLDWSAGMRQVGAIASFALILGSTGRHERCTELLGFCEDNSMAGWKDEWSVTHDIVRQAKSTLGEELYQAAFERGKSLNLETIVQELLDEFGEDD
jgi:tetratricopeptide (TPR) repeat protein